MPSKLSEAQVLERSRPRCLTCKYWKRTGIEGKESDFDYGTCPKVWVAFNPESLTKLVDPLVGIKTHQQFGCMLHRKKFKKE